MLVKTDIFHYKMDKKSDILFRLPKTIRYKETRKIILGIVRELSNRGELSVGDLPQLHRMATAYDCYLQCVEAISENGMTMRNLKGEVVKRPEANLLKESWASLFGDGERRVIENTNGGLIMSIRYDCPEENEEIVVYRGGFDEKMNRHGYGIEYDRKSGREKIEGYWEKDQLIQVIREFDIEKNIMIEYAEETGADRMGRLGRARTRQGRRALSKDSGKRGA